MAIAVPLLEQAWDEHSGFLGLLRRGVFDADALECLVATLEAVTVGDAPVLDRRFVEVTWYIPLFLSWQRERALNSGDVVIRQIDDASNRLLALLEGLLGVP